MDVEELKEAAVQAEEVIQAVLEERTEVLKANLEEQYEETDEETETIKEAVKKLRKEWMELEQEEDGCFHCRVTGVREEEPDSWICAPEEEPYTRRCQVNVELGIPFRKGKMAWEVQIPFHKKEGNWKLDREWLENYVLES